MTDILTLSNWAVLSVEHSDELIIKAEYLVQPANNFNHAL